ncbi:MAG: Xaa-Pro peptidase family protein [Oscillospiraceae bacterium]|nr:Xaa-Pro peptidase family protein [Oscillospiraceae bacterium]
MNNIQKIQKALPEYEADAILIKDPTNRLYATGFSSSAGALLITAENAWFVIDSRYFEAAQKQISGAQVQQLEKGSKYDDQVDRLIKENSINSIGFEETTLTYSSYQAWSEKFGVRLVPAQKLINNLRNIKSRLEVDKMIKAQRLAEKVFDEILPIISTDMTEKELSAEIVYRMLKNGADETAFLPIVVSGANSSRPHGVPGDDKIAEGFITLDFGACLDGWRSDMTRTLCIGKPTDEMVNVYDTVLKAQLSGIAAVFGGVRGVDVDAAARNVIEEAGYGEFFGHGFSHSIGLDVHETLSASPLSEDILPAGAMISAEPGIYLPGRFGVRIEDVLYITDDGSENITSISKTLTVL